MQVRSFVVQVADWAVKGDLDTIETFQHLGEAFKWKIAFHYQNRQIPVIVDIFKRAPLAVFVGGTAIQRMVALQKAALAQRPNDIGILEFGRCRHRASCFLQSWVFVPCPESCVKQSLLVPMVTVR